MSARRENAEPVDARLGTPGREGLTGTAPADRYTSVVEREPLEIGPDGRPLAEQPHWRREFPIDFPEDDHVARRDFVKFLILTSFAFLFGQLWIVVQNWRRRRRGRPEIRRIASVDQIPVGGAITFAYPGERDSCILLRPEPRVLVAFRQECTHLACAVIPRLGEDRLYCPCHNGVFDAFSGRPLEGPPSRPLPRVQVELRGREIYASGVELRTV